MERFIKGRRQLTETLCFALLCLPATMTIKVGRWEISKWTSTGLSRLYHIHILVSLQVVMYQKCRLL